jgi:hypothetical protein
VYKIFEYSHLGGSEILQVRFPEIDREINSVIESIKGVERTKKSKEKTMRGKMLYSPVDLNKRFSEAFASLGYKELIDRFDIDIPGHPFKIKNNYKQVDFAKGKVLCEVQFGKYFSMFYDLAKFQYFFNEMQAELGIEIVPTHRLHKNMSTGTSYGEQLVWDIGRLRRHFPQVPVKVILIDVDPPPAEIVVTEEGLESSLEGQKEDMELSGKKGRAGPRTPRRK